MPGAEEVGAAEARARRVERRLERPLFVAALLTIPVIAIGESRAGHPWRDLVTALNWSIWTPFIAEVVVMLIVAPSKRHWLRDHPLDVAIVVLTPPFLPASLQAARIFRLARLLRLLRAATLARRLLSTEGIRDAAVLALLTVLGGGAAFAALERGHHDPDLTSWDGVWWAMTTVTTVGYGDVSPRTDGGRVLAIVVMLIGIGFVAILTAAAADKFVASRREVSEEREELRQRLDEVIRRLDAMERR